MNYDTVAAAFADYQKLVIPVNAPHIQVEECRRAYYAGAYFLLMTLANSFDEDTPEADGIAMLEDLKAEIERYAAAAGAPGIMPTQPDISYTTADPDQIKPILQKLGGAIGSGLPVGYGFCLFLFTYQAGNVFYISSGDRADVLIMIREFLKKQVS